MQTPDIRTIKSDIKQCELNHKQWRTKNMFSCINRTGVAAVLSALLLPWCVSCGDDDANTASTSTGTDYTECNVLGRAPKHSWALPTSRQ